MTMASIGKTYHLSKEDAKTVLTLLNTIPEKIKSPEYYRAKKLQDRISKIKDFLVN